MSHYGGKPPHYHGFEYLIRVSILLPAGVLFYGR